jgi:hypothetical protein
MKAHEGRHVVLSTHQNIGVDAAPRLRAIVQCLVSQAMPFFEQDELALFHVTRCDASISGSGSSAGTASRKRSVRTCGNTSSGLPPGRAMSNTSSAPRVNSPTKLNLARRLRWHAFPVGRVQR